MSEQRGNKFFYDGFVDYACIPDSFEKKFHDMFRKIGVVDYDSIMVYFTDNKLLMPIIIALGSFKLKIFLANANVISDRFQVKKVKFIITDNNKWEFGLKVNTFLMLDKKVSIYKINNCEIVGECLEETNYVFYTSGTQGDEKKIVRSSSILINEAKAILKKLQWNSQEIILCNAPVFHSFGQAFGCFAAYIARCRVKYFPSFSLPGHLVRELQSNHYSVFISTPLYYNEIYEQLLTIKLKYMLSAGGRLSIDVINSGLKINNVYGSTETGVISIQDYKNKGDCGCVGTPVDGVSILIGKEIFKRENLRLCEIEVSSRYMYTGEIHNGQIESNKQLSLRTGDIGYVDGSNNLFVYGRTDEIVNIYGEKISLKDVETVIQKCELVDKVKLQKEEDLHGSEYLIAFVIVCKECCEADILEYCRMHLARHKIPRKIKIVERFTLSETGKIVKRQ